MYSLHAEYDVELISFTKEIQITKQIHRNITQNGNKTWLEQVLGSNLTDRMHEYDNQSINLKKQEG